MKKKIGILVICLLLFVLGWNVFQYLSLRSKAIQNLDKEIVIHTDCDIDLLGLMDSYGVNYNPEIDSNFQDFLAGSLDEQGHLSSSLNLYNLYCNKTWELDGIFKNGIVLSDLVKMQNYSLDFTRHKYGNQIRSDMIYEAPSGLENETIYNYMASLEHPVVLYSCTANDLFYYYSVSLESMSFGKVVEWIKNWENGQELLKNEVISNLSTLLSCNPNAQIFVMGLYIPTDNFFLQRLGAPFVNAINKQIDAACSKYENAYYVDCSTVSFAVLDNDFHPDEEGQYLIAVALSEAINENLKDFTKEKTQRKEETDIPSKKSLIPEINASEIWDRIGILGLPVDDYVECAVAVEKVLQECGKADISASELEIIREQFSSVLTGHKLIQIQEALDIMIIERKIHQGYHLETYTLNKTPQNDKLSLINYY